MGLVVTWPRVVNRESLAICRERMFYRFGEIKLEIIYLGKKNRRAHVDQDALREGKSYDYNLLPVNQPKLPRIRGRYYHVMRHA